MDWLARRIAAIADVFDALTNNRVYRKAFTLGEAVEMMKAGSGTHFDPELFDLFLDAMDKVLEIRESASDGTPAVPIQRV
jgi:putative two-component system response regulator